MEGFIRSLPNPAAARTFLIRLHGETRPEPAGGDSPLFLSRLLTIAAYSPFLAENLLRNPDHLEWLRRETATGFDRVKSIEQVSQDLARFVSRISGTDRRSALGEFKRRELVRIYLRDCLEIATLAEVTEELSNLADAILRDALSIARQEITNKYGSPLARDERGRTIHADFVIVALGKLGCRELNYASDIDLLFLCSGEGQTAGGAGRGESVIDNKTFFTRVAERVVRMIGGGSGEGAVYRIDLRLRPYGRDGDLVWDVERAADYYRTHAHGWERQALIRARVAAGSDSVFSRFMDLVRDQVFRPEPLPIAFTEVRRAREKIDRKAASAPGGFNVKLGRGGIREIEFIAQVLQLAYGGREPWVRSAQTLIVLARLAEKGHLTEVERARLSSAYTFLRRVEHRLQMENGVQTHKIPLGRGRLELLARRMGYLTGRDPVDAFNHDLATHTAAVRAIYNRVFSTEVDTQPQPAPASRPALDLGDETERLIERAVQALQRLLAIADLESRRASSTDQSALFAAGMASALKRSINPLRSLRNLIAWADSLATYDPEEASRATEFLAGDRLGQGLGELATALCAEYLSHLLISRPALASALQERRTRLDRADCLSSIGNAIENASDAQTRSDTLRRAWYRLVTEIGYRDLAANIEGSHLCGQSKPELADPRLLLLRSNNLEQTALAEASIEAASSIALRSLGIEGFEWSAIPFTILAMGRLGHCGMDYGSDLDLLIVYDEPAAADLLRRWTGKVAAPGSAQEWLTAFGARLVSGLSSVTREGMLYRVDFRLRPEGQSGQLAQALESMLEYLRSRASAWEHSAYLKVREVAGNLELGARARRAICEAVFEAASSNESLKEELAAMRLRLEKEKGGGRRHDIKWGRGGMTDAYFVTRYLQLRDRIYYPPEEGTGRLISHLGETRSLAPDHARELAEGYSFLRQVDHWMRLLLDRPGSKLPASIASRAEIAKVMGLAGVEEFNRGYDSHVKAIRGVYDAVFG
jgi:[glutamine synthetase] adenylyltransferase / [glutamine synthetase]-adenylyl-L-tyrosine phosphorylase